MILRLIAAALNFRLNSQTSEFNESFRFKFPELKITAAPFKAHCDWINEHSVPYASTTNPIRSSSLPKPSAKRIRAFGLDWLESTIKSLPPTTLLKTDREPIEVSEGKTVYYKAEESVFNWENFYNFVNKIPIDDAIECSSVIAEAYNQGVFYHRSKSNLVEQMFLAATYKSNLKVDRLLQLLAKKKHLQLSDSDKAWVMNRVMDTLSVNGVSVVSNEFVELVQKLVDYGFLEFVDEYRLTKAFSNHQIMEIILRADRDIFKNLSVKRLFSVIQGGDFYLAKMYLALGVDASQVYNGRNALDAASVANSQCQRFFSGLEAVPEEFEDNSTAYRKHCTEVEVERQDLIQILEARGLSMSWTIENYDEAVNAKLYDLAAEILKKAEFDAPVQYSRGDDRISPLSVALSRKHAPTINTVMKEYLRKLTIPQLMEAKQIIFWFYNEKPDEVLEWLAQINAQITLVKASRSPNKR